jgi:hypothetical protein
MLHGLGAHPITLKPLEWYLNYIGHVNTYNIKYKVNQYATVQQSVDEVDTILLDAGMQKTTDELILIGQSMGGVVANNLHTAGWNIVFAIYIGSPLHGANLINQLERTLPRMIINILNKPPYDILKNKDREDEPPHPYKTITMSWLFTSSFDGCVYKNEAMLDEQNNMHLYAADHRTVFANPRLWFKVGKLIDGV